MTEAPADGAVDKGAIGRAIGVLVSPGATFAAVVKEPRPAVILLIVCLIIGLATGLPQFTARGQRAALDMQVQQIERFTGQTVTPEMYSQMERRAQYGGYLAMGSVFIFVPVVTMLFGALYWAIFNAILGGTATFKQVLGVVAHSQVIGALGAAAAAPIQYAQGIQSVTGPFNLGALVPMLAPDHPVAQFLGALSAFTVWQLVVTAIGLAVLYRRRSTGIAVALITAYILLTAGFTAAFSSLTGR